MWLMVDTIREMNEKSLETVAAQSSANSRRMWLIILLVIIVLAAAIGVTASVQLPGDVVIGATPETQPVSKKNRRKHKADVDSQNQE